MKTLKTIGTLLLVILLVSILISNIYVMLNADKPGVYPSVLGISTAVVVSGSMEPTIGVGDLIVIQSRRAYQVGDVITFSTGGQLPVTHRIIAQNPDGSFVTKGDANNSADLQPIPQEEIAGKVVFTLAGGGRVMEFLRSPLGLLLMVLVIFAALVAPERKKNTP